MTHQKHHKKKPPKVLVADEASSCFSDVRWKAGQAFVTFARDGSQYSYPMSRSDFEEWMDSGSLGKFFNEVIR